MKKIIVLLVGILALSIFTGCSSGYTFSEVVAKQNERIEEFDNAAITLDMEISVETLGMTEEMFMRMIMTIENMHDPDAVIGHATVDMFSMGFIERVTMYLIGDLVYMEVAGERLIESSDAFDEMANAEFMNIQEEVAQQMDRFFSFSRRGGYLYFDSNSRTFPQLIQVLMETGMAMGTGGSDDFMNEMIMMMLDEANISGFVQYVFSEDYILQSITMEMLFEVNMFGFTMDMALKMHGTIEYFEGSRIVLPDLSLWDAAPIIPYGFIQIESSDLYGEWAWDINEDFRYIFNADGTGADIYDGDEISFVWSIDEEFLYIDFSYWVEIWLVEIDGDILTMTSIDRSGTVWHYIRQ